MSYEKVLFTVMRVNGRESPSIYVDGIPLREKGSVVWGIELKTAEAKAERVEDMFRMYRFAKAFDSLAPSEITDRDFYSSK